MKKKVKFKIVNSLCLMSLIFPPIVNASEVISTSENINSYIETTTFEETTEETSMTEETTEETSMIEDDVMTIWNNRENYHVISVTENFVTSGFSYMNNEYVLYETISSNYNEVYSELYINLNGQEEYVGKFSTTININQNNYTLNMYNNNEKVISTSGKVYANTNCPYEYKWVSNTSHGGNEIYKFTAGAIMTAIGAATGIKGAVSAYVVKYLINNRIRTVYWTMTIKQKVKRSKCNVNYPHWLDAGEYRYTIKYYSNSARTNLIGTVKK